MQFMTCGFSVRRATFPRALAGFLLFLVFAGHLFGQGTTVSDKWRLKTGGDIFGAPALSPDGQTVYIGSSDGNLYAAEAATGRTNWLYAARLSTENSIRSSPAVAADGTIYFGSGDRLYALTPGGTLKWQNTTYAFDINISGTVYSAPAINSDGKIVVAGAENRRVFIFNPDGSLNKFQSYPGNFISSPAIGVDNGIYIGGLDGNLYALTSTLGNRWIGRTTQGISGGAAIGPDGTIYVGSADNKLYAFAQEGGKRWEFVTGDAIFAAPVVGPDGTVYVGSWDNKFYAVNPNGSLKWSFLAEGLVHGSAAIAADGTIYVPTDVGAAGRLYALDSQGRELWRFNSGEQLHASPLIGPDGTVYVGSFDDHLFAIRGSSPPAISAWPMIARTVSRPGRMNAQISITSPRAGKVFTAPARVAVEAALSVAPGGSLVNLELYLGTNLVARQTSFPFNTPITISETNRHLLQMRATVRNLDGTQDIVSSAPVPISVIQNRNAPVLSAIPDVTTSKQAQIPFTASDAETPPEELFFVVESASSLIPSRNTQIGGSPTNRILIVIPEGSASVPLEGIPVPISLTVYDGELGDPATKFARRDFIVTVLPPTTPPVILLGSPVDPATGRLRIFEDPIGDPVEVTVNVADEEDSFDKLILTFESLDPEIIPSANITTGTLDAIGFARFVRFLPATNQSGLARILLTVRDLSGETASTNLVVSIQPVNDAPILSRIENQTLADNDASRRVFFSVRDVDTPSSAVTVRATSSNSSLFPPGSITIDGTGESRSLVIRPVPGQAGTATISLVATDTSSSPTIGSAPSSFTVTVLRSNTPPQISPIPQISTFEDTPIVPVEFTVSDADSPATSLLVSVTTTNTVLVPPANIRVEGSGANRTLFLVPATNQFGTNLVVVTVSDPQGATNRAIFQLVVTPLNDSPSISAPLDVVLDEDTVSLPLPFTVGDVETAAGALTVTASSSNPALLPVSGITLGTVDGTNRTVSLRPAADAAGRATVTLNVFDGEGRASAVFQVQVNGVNDAPQLSMPGPVSVSKNQRSPLPPITGSDVDAGTNLVRLTFAVAPGNLELTTVGGLVFQNGTNGGSAFQALGNLADLNAAMGTMRYTPPTNFSGPASVSVILSDLGNSGAGGNLNASGVLSITVLAANEPPTVSAIPDVRVDRNGISDPIAFTVGDAETDPNLLRVSFSSSDPVLMPVSRVEFLGEGANRAVVLRPARDRTGTAVIELTVTDGGGLTATTRFNLIVEARNLPPTLTLSATVFLVEDAPGGSGPVALTVADPDTPLSSLLFSATSSNTNLIGTNGIVFGGTGASRTLTLIPQVNQFGTTLVSVVVSDGTFLVTNTLNVGVAPVNDPPSFTKGPDLSVKANEGPREFPGWATGMSAGPPNESGQVLRFQVAAADPSLFATQPSIDVSGTLRFTTAADRSGSSTVLVTLVDDGGISGGGIDSSGPAIFEITVLAVNQPPVFIKGPDVSVLEDSGSARFPGWATGIRPGPPGESSQTLTFLVTNSAPALFSTPPAIAVDGTLSFVPARDAFGAATVSVRLRDNGGTDNGGIDLSAEQTFLLTLVPVNDPPTLDPVPDLTIDEDSGETGIELKNLGFGPLNEIQTLNITATSDNRALLPDPKIRFTGVGSANLVLLLPNTNATGSSVVTLTVRDSGGVENGGVDSLTRSFVLTVLGVEDPPSIGAIPDQVTEQGKPTGAIPIPVSDPDSPVNKLVLTAVSQNSALVLPSGFQFTGTGPTRTMVVTPAPGVSGTSVITVFLSDGTTTNQTTFKLTVTSVDRPPRIAGLGSRVMFEDESAVTVPFTVTDPDTAVGTLEVTAVSSDPSLVAASGIVVARASSDPGETNFVLRLTPVPDRSGSLKITVTAADRASTVSQELAVTILPVNDAPSFVGGPDVVVREDVAAQSISGWAKSFSTGPADETSQNLRFELSHTSPELFAAPPALSPDGTLIFTAAPNAFGVSAVSVALVDDGGVANGGLDRSPTYVFAIRVEPINDAPTLNTINNLTRDEDSGAFTLVVSGIGSGAPNEAQTLTLSAVSSQRDLVPDPVISYSSPLATGRLVFTPATNATGSATITVTVKDDGGVANGGRDTVQQQFILTLAPVNDAPVVGTILPRSTTENTPSAPIPITLSDVDTPVELLTMVVTSGNAGLIADTGLKVTGTGATRTLVVTPERDRTGETTITVVAGDGQLFATNRFAMIVSAVNQPPVVGVPADAVTDEDTVVVVPLLISDRENANPLVTLESSNSALVPAAGLLLGGTGTNRTLTVRPAANASGETTLRVVVNDGSLSATNAFRVRVRPVNDRPNFSAGLNVEVNEDSGLQRLPAWARDISAGPPDESGQTLRFDVSNSAPALFALQPAISNDGTFSFQPAPNAFGVAEVRVVLVDDGGVLNGGLDRSEPVSFTLTARAVNDAPTLNSINNLTRDEDSGVFTLVVSGIGSGASNEAQALTLSAVSSAPGIVEQSRVVYTSPETTGRLVFTPVANATGKATITVTVQDDGGTAQGGVDSVQQVFTLTLEPVNDAPTLAPIAPQSTTENRPTGPIALTIGDVDNAVETLTLSATSSDPALVPASGLVFSGSGPARTLVATPAANKTGEATITVSVNDGALSATQTFLLMVVSVNQPPVIGIAGDVSTDEDVPVTIPLLIVDRENDTVQVDVETSNAILLPQAGIELSGTGTNRLLTLRPATNASGESVIKVMAGDGRLRSTNAFKLFVRAVNDAPSFSRILDQAVNQDGVSAAIPLVIEDVDTAPALLEVLLDSSNPGLLPLSGIVEGGPKDRRTLTLTPAPGKSGSSLVTVTVRDGEHLISQSFTVIVSAPNTPPSILAQPVGRTVLVGTTVSFSVTSAGTAPLSFQWTLNGTNLPSATNAVLTLPGVVTGSSGRYAVRVRNTAGSAVSDDAVLIVGQLGSKLWDVATGGQVRSSAALGPDGTVYVGSDDGRVYALSPFGQRKWEFVTGGPVVSSPMISDGTIYVGSQDGHLYALQTNGVQRWRFEAGAAIDSSPAISRDGTVYFGCNNNKLFAVNADGTERWSVAVGGLIYSSPAVDAAGRIYFGAYDNRVYALDADGNRLWEFATGGVVASSPAIGPDGTIYFGSSDKRLYALRPDGTRRWHYLASASISGSPVVGAEGQVYFGAEDGKLVALNADGTRRWDFATGGPVYGAPALGNDGTLYVASFDAKLYAVNANGSKRWEYATGGPLYAAPTLDREGVLYQGSYDGKIYGIRGTTGLADAPWPMFHRDQSHQGRVPAAAVEPLRIRAAAFLAGGGLELQISGPAGAAVIVETSPDLAIWARLDSLVLPSGAAVYRDTRPALRQLFYRIRKF